MTTGTTLCATNSQELLSNLFVFLLGVLEIKPRALLLLVKHSATELYPFRELLDPALWCFIHLVEKSVLSLNHPQRILELRQEHALGCLAHSRIWLGASHSCDLPPLPSGPSQEE